MTGVFDLYSAERTQTGSLKKWQRRQNKAHRKFLAQLASWPGVGEVTLSDPGLLSTEYFRAQSIWEAQRRGMTSTQKA